MKESFFKLNLADDSQVLFEKIEQKSELQNIFLCKQVHGFEGVRVTDKENVVKAPTEADWIWTTERAVSLGILVADCTAIMVSGMRETGEKFWCGIHAGWRGTAAGIILKSFEVIKPKSFSAWLSPSICQGHFEVGEEVIEALGPRATRYAKRTENKKFLLDLKALQIDQLNAFNGKVLASSLCTYCQPEFLSYRKAKGHLDARHLVSLTN